MTKTTNVAVLDGVSDDNKASSSEEESETVEELDVEIAFSEPSSGSGLSIFEEFQDNAKILDGSLSSSDSLSDLDDLDDDAEERTAASVVSIFSEYNEFEPLSEGGSEDDLESFSSDSDLEIVSNPCFLLFQYTQIIHTAFIPLHFWLLPSSID